MSGTMRERLMQMCGSGNPEHVARFREVIAGVTVTLEGRRRGFISLGECIDNGVAVSDEIQRRAQGKET